jgi:hypothetical protein
MTLAFLRRQVHGYLATKHRIPGQCLERLSLPDSMGWRVLLMCIGLRVNDCFFFFSLHLELVLAPLKTHTSPCKFIYYLHSALVLLIIYFLKFSIIFKIMSIFQFHHLLFFFIYRYLSNYNFFHIRPLSF